MFAETTRAPRLLVATDFDGTLAPIVDDPDAATALPVVIEALRRLSRLEDTWVAVVSGRRHLELAERFGDDVFYLIGEHGADRGHGTEADSPALDRARRRVEAAVAAAPGSFSEQKKVSVAFHYRLAPDAGPALAELLAWADSEPELETMQGKSIVELSAIRLDKGAAVMTLRDELGADAVLFIGDDTTDESVFVVLGPGDLGVKVGPGETAAAMRVSGPEAVGDLLHRLADIRERAEDVRALRHDG